MKLEITLEDPKFCDDCPCLSPCCSTRCGKGYYSPGNIYEDLDEEPGVCGNVIRPKKCIEENGL